jgi:flagellar basal-body rod modification protein FlgD
MTVSGTGNTSNPATTQYTTKASASSGMIDNPNAALGKNDFLQMLVTKLQNQDPLDVKMDESFMADMAQFSSLEQTTNVNTSLGTTNQSILDLNKNMIGLMLMQNSSQAASLIGKTVTVKYDVLDSKGNQTFDTDGNKITALATNTVNMVKFVDGQPKIQVGSTLYDLSQVQEISA